MFFYYQHMQLLHITDFVLYLTSQNPIGGSPFTPDGNYGEPGVIMLE